VADIVIITWNATLTIINMYLSRPCFQNGEARNNMVNTEMFRSEIDLGEKLLMFQSFKSYAPPKETNLEHQANEKL
jgi:hypothetical protein